MILDSVFEKIVVQLSAVIIIITIICIIIITTTNYYHAIHYHFIIVIVITLMTVRPMDLTHVSYKPKCMVTANPDRSALITIIPWHFQFHLVNVSILHLKHEYGHARRLHKSGAHQDCDLERTAWMRRWTIYLYTGILKITLSGMRCHDLFCRVYCEYFNQYQADSQRYFRIWLL